MTRSCCTGTPRSATIKVIAGDLGVSEATLSAWCKAAGVAIRRRNLTVAAQLGHGVETAEQELARLRAENKALRAAEARLSTERDILRSAAKYFAGETEPPRLSCTLGYWCASVLVARC